jgi:hypothetical protein
MLSSFKSPHQFDRKVPSGYILKEINMSGYILGKIMKETCDLFYNVSCGSTAGFF